MRSSPDNIRRLTRFRDLKDAIYFYTDTDKSSLTDFVYKLSINDLLTELGNRLTGGGPAGVSSVGVESTTLDVNNTPITSTGNIQVELPATGVTAGNYSNPSLTIDAQGRVTGAASSGPIATLYTADGTLTGARYVDLAGNDLTFATSVNVSGVTKELIQYLNQDLYSLSINNYSLNTAILLTVSSLMLRAKSSAAPADDTFIEITQTEGIKIKDTLSSKGLVGDADYSANYTNFSYVQKSYIDSKLANNIVLRVSSLANLPPAIGGVISIPTLTTLIFEGDVDLGTNRLVFASDCAILGTTSETSYLKSTLPDNVPLITATGSLPIQNITLEVIASSGTPYIFELDGIAEPAAALDWFGVNCRNSKLGNIKNYANFVATLCAFIDTKGGFVFDGTFDSIVFTNSIFRGVAASGTHITILSTATINKRVRLVDTPIIVPTGVVGLDVSTSASIPTEGYILRFINFSGGGTYLQGVQPDDNKSVVIECRGVSNSGNIGEYYMVNNTTATTISNTTSFFKIAGTTTAGAYLQRVTITNNRATYTGAITRFFLVQSTISMTAGNAQLLIARIAKNGVTIASSESQTTTSNTGRSENVKCQTIVQLNTNDYVEVFVQNNSAASAITVSELNTILIPLS